MKTKEVHDKLIIVKLNEIAQIISTKKPNIENDCDSLPIEA